MGNWTVKGNVTKISTQYYKTFKNSFSPWSIEVAYYEMSRLMNYWDSPVTQQKQEPNGSLSDVVEVTIAVTLSFLFYR